MSETAGGAPLTWTGRGRAMNRPRSLILGLGNELISDDGFGPAVARVCRSALIEGESSFVESAAVAGLRLLDLLQGYDRVLILDVVQTGKHPPGTLLNWPLSRASCGRTLGGSHQTDLSSTIELGRLLGYPLPAEIALLVAEAEDLETIREALSPALELAVPEAALRALSWLRGDCAAAKEFGTEVEQSRYGRAS